MNTNTAQDLQEGDIVEFTLKGDRRTAEIMLVTIDDVILLDLFDGDRPWRGPAGLAAGRRGLPARSGRDPRRRLIRTPDPRTPPGSPFAPDRPPRVQRRIPELYGGGNCIAVSVKFANPASGPTARLTRPGRGCRAVRGPRRAVAAHRRPVATRDPPGGRRRCSHERLSGQPSTSTSAHRPGAPRRRSRRAAGRTRPRGRHRAPRPGAGQRHRHPDPPSVGLALVQQGDAGQRQGDGGRRPAGRRASAPAAARRGSRRSGPCGPGSRRRRRGGRGSTTPASPCTSRS